MELDWLTDLCRNWEQRRSSGRMPHAVLLAGPAGLGKRAAAAWMAGRHLGLAGSTALPTYPLAVPEHADLRWIRPLEDKTTISIEQIRDLVAEIGLTSYAGRGKAAVIEPANAMTQNAANSLLKTLEEPPGNALLVLVADRHGRLPATIFSRCQRIDVQQPPAAEALRWLDRLQPGGTWAEALELAGGSPLAAIGALERLETHAAMLRDLRGVAAGTLSPLEVAGRWAASDPGFVLDWLARQVQQAIARASGARLPSAGTGIDDSVLERMDSRNLFCYLDTINRLRGQPTGSYNVQLTLESLLIDWSEGMASAGPAGERGPLPMLATR